MWGSTNRQYVQPECDGGQDDVDDVVSIADSVDDGVNDGFKTSTIDNSTNINPDERGDHLVDDIEDARFAINDLTARVKKLEMLLINLLSDGKGSLTNKNTSTLITVKKTKATTERSIRIVPKTDGIDDRVNVSSTSRVSKMIGKGDDNPHAPQVSTITMRSVLDCPVSIPHTTTFDEVEEYTGEDSPIVTHVSTGISTCRVKGDQPTVEEVGESSPLPSSTTTTILPDTRRTRDRSLDTQLVVSANNQQLVTMMEESRQMIVQEATNKALNQVAKFIETQIVPVMEKMNDNISYLQYQNFAEDEMNTEFRKRCQNQIKVKDMIADMQKDASGGNKELESIADIERQQYIMKQKDILFFDDDH
jgi:hypothetical protein